MEVPIQEMYEEGKRGMGSLEMGSIAGAANRVEPRTS